ncbi:ATP-grasp fold amidoligase family protein [Flavobacterium sp. GCM10023249]|uniref:ATP-grasp fold amidoligase family protein n=1 Tax=unclassified Flavobacterium TaxID=196869 RepID=UPI00361DDFD0
MNFFRKKFCQLYLNLLKTFSSNDIAISKLQFYLKTGEKLNLENPVTFADKLQWLKLFYYDESFGKFADKYQCREVVKERVGEDILVKLIATYDSVDAINFDKLPNKFALKCSHGSGYNLIVHDKSKLNLEKERARLRKFMASNYYYKFREKIYKNLKPIIIVEELLEQGNGNTLIDYKFQCFDGVPANVLIKSTENGIGKMAVYDLNWTKYQPDVNCKIYLEAELPKPANLDQMKDVAARLSEGFPFLRVDLYSVDDTIYFGELTFIPNGGAKKILLQCLNEQYGKLLQLPKFLGIVAFSFLIMNPLIVFYLCPVLLLFQSMLPILGEIPEVIIDGETSLGLMDANWKSSKLS